MASANDTLQNVFAACEKEPNIVPFDKIILRRKADTLSACISKHATIIMILILICVPLFTLQTNANIETKLSTSSIHIVDHYVTNNAIHLILEDNNYYYSSCYSLDANGTRNLAIIDPVHPNHLVFTYTGVMLHLYLGDEVGKYLHLIITPNE